MKWRRGKRSPDLRDQRAGGGLPGGGRFPGGGGRGFPIPAGRMGGGGLVGLVVILILFFVIRGCDGSGGGFDIPDPTAGFPQAPASGKGDSVPKGPDPEAEQVDFVSFVLDDAQGFWEQQFQAAGKPYQRAKLVLFRDAVGSGCGQASSATGPFYCPLDRQVYLDLGFFDQLNQRFQAPGDFAQAYVIAHEIGHHLQQQLGIEEEVRAESERNPDDANELSIRLELQADCFAGVWGRSTYDRGILESGDLDEGLNAASAVGDDRIQEQAQGRIDPESWTHGSAEQRAKWLQTGFDSGQLEACDTFSGEV
jgi:predicted metalloprotease